MNKKILVVIAIIFLLFIGCIVYFNFLSSQETIIVNNIEFKLPNGYNEAGKNNFGDITIDNGTDKIFLGYYNDSDIKEHIKNYKNYTDENNTVIISNYTLNNLTVYKSSSSLGNNHYWFVSNNTTYSIYNWNKNPYIDSTVNELIRNANLTYKLN